MSPIDTVDGMDVESSRAEPWLEQESKLSVKNVADKAPLGLGAGALHKKKQVVMMMTVESDPVMSNH